MFSAFENPEQTPKTLKKTKEMVSNNGNSKETKQRTKEGKKDRVGALAWYHPNGNGCYFNFSEIVAASASVM